LYFKNGDFCPFPLILSNHFSKKWASSFEKSWEEKKKRGGEEIKAISFEESKFRLEVRPS